MTKGTFDLKSDELCWLKETLIYRLVCAPKSWTPEKVQEATNTKFGGPGTTLNQWVIAKATKKDPNPIPCPDDKKRQHWILNC